MHHTHVTTSARSFFPTLKFLAQRQSGITHIRQPLLLLQPPLYRDIPGRGKCRINKGAILTNLIVSSTGWDDLRAKMQDRKQWNPQSRPRPIRALTHRVTTNTREIKALTEWHMHLDLWHKGEATFVRAIGGNRGLQGKILISKTTGYIELHEPQAERIPKTCGHSRNTRMH